MKRYMNPLGQPLIETAQGEYVLYVDYLEAMRHANNNVAERDEAREEAMTLRDAIRNIGDYAHDRSTGPAVPDALWEIRRMAYDELSDAARSAMPGSAPTERKT